LLSWRPRRQFMLHVKYLQDSRTGLWFHGWTFEGRHNFAKALWARGNSWVTIAIPEFIEMLDLQPGDGLRSFLLGTLEAQVRTLAKHQDASGLWHTLIDDPKSYLEASATAGFAYGLSGGQPELAQILLARSLRGDYLLTTEHLAGERRIVFVGRDPVLEPALDSQVGEPYPY